MAHFTYPMLLALSTNLGGQREFSAGHLSKPYLGLLACALRQRRRALDLSQGTCADNAGLSRATWALLERGVSANPTLETIRRAASAIQLAAYLQFFEAPQSQIAAALCPLCAKKVNFL